MFDHINISYQLSFDLEWKLQGIDLNILLKIPSWNAIFRVKNTLRTHMTSVQYMETHRLGKNEMTFDIYM